mmetsp:Transcript_37506/g.120314  ORF Transcript_37506/g.120314 Transcript_37506/m.120314 type:complete len:510 (+) Transcript_37506:1454-2983(+)|eukprot:CAMPEP_0118919612 /NCGR_PEP_ID=MMETSP1166-20130328/18646_1 /TAXON_ID=1104430 /ORGANISM="Chrysoreinhardia sp, Strain CCMP3193" /LENGTH=509 /DNA_ID=CAMNT_0006860143 /DNA_START=73 /DNA_END=1602 /DNA_ORIENTATION=+
MAEMSESSARRCALDGMVGGQGFDVVIVCTGTEAQASYWKGKLEERRVIPSTCEVICVHEDWKSGGAGNGLGTLYAWQKAADESLTAKLKTKEISVALYHTAGKGTRLAPLPGAENNNKPGVKLPACVGEAPLTILESVIKQTGIYAASRKGRLSVFWGDQIFVPTVAFTYEPTAHADILCALGPMPSAEEWAEQGLDKYGLIAVARSGDACQIEKVDHATAVAMTKDLGEIVAVGTSLGSFSVSSTLLECFLSEFQPELKRQDVSLDTDPHWWMPATLPTDAYCQLMAKKGQDEATSKKHKARIDAMLEKNSLKTPNGYAHFLGPVDVGANAYWWDYGQLKLYLKNAFRLIAPGVEADAMREFMGVKCVDGSARSNANLGADSKVTASVLANVNVESLHAHEAVVVNTTAKKLVCGKGAVAYNVLEENGELVLADGEVLTDVFMPDGSKVRQRSRIDIDGGKAWKTTIEGNPFSFEQVYKTNLTTDVVQTSKLANDKHKALAATLNLL